MDGEEKKRFLFAALHLFGNHFGFDLGLAWEKQIKLIGNQQRAGREVKRNSYWESFLLFLEGA